MEKINKLSIPTTILIASIILGGFYYASQLNRQNSLGKQQVNNFDSDIQCSKQAQSFYDWYNGEVTKSSLAYENHFNKKLNKCFVLVYGNGPTGTDVSYVDLYDAIEKKHYAMFIGHNYCSKGALSVENNLKKCEVDFGRIWLTGIDSTEPDIITTEPGDEQTKAEFLNLIKSFMND